jgi:hypothetical protein
MVFLGISIIGAVVLGGKKRRLVPDVAGRSSEWWLSR